MRKLVDMDFEAVIIMLFFAIYTINRRPGYICDDSNVCV
jgi:hypothetical protein